MAFISYVRDAGYRDRVRVRVRVIGYLFCLPDLQSRPNLVSRYRIEK